MEETITNSKSFIILDYNEMHTIQGGTIQESYDAGYKLGQYLRQLWDSWGIVKWIFA